ncbi:hypothetical protein THRCLA_00698 [Thraustotheca clavata]|uniref:HTH myb-type domain-containing protein n=1 Tax=Thraustotheca clavata TaxID=74557 RepID=A0A1W0AAI6_9STRA|nr:hypothetical protein THRCLA_00698 [Thraustotheca clavata]
MLPPQDNDPNYNQKKRQRIPIENQGPWSAEEHERFLIALQVCPEGPWKSIAEIVQTRNAKQTQTHMQKCKEKLFRQHRRQSTENNNEQQPYTCIRSKHSLNLRLPTIQPIPFTPDTTGNNEISSEMLLLDDSPSTIPLEEALDFFLSLPNAD